MRVAHAVSAVSGRRFYIHSGVRRALASLKWGRKTIPAFILREGAKPAFRPRLRLDSLHSPKRVLTMDDRFVRIVPPIRTPIEVEPLGVRGQGYSVPLARVRLD